MREDEPRLLTLAVRLGINAASLWVASELIRGFDITGWESILATAAIFAAVNAVIKPAVSLLGLPITCLTLGLFTIVINAAMLALAVWIADAFDFDVEIDGWVAAFLAALLISVVSALLSAFVGRPVRRALT